MFWTGLVDWLREQLLGNGKIAEDDLLLFEIMDDVDEIVSYIRKTVVF